MELILILFLKTTTNYHTSIKRTPNETNEIVLCS